MARKKKNKDEEVQEGKKKGGKKKLLLIPLALILVAAIGAAAVLFVLPRFGINLMGPGEEPGPGEEEPPKNLEVYALGEEAKEEGGESTLDSTISLDTLLEEGEGTLIAVRKAEETEVTKDEVTTVIPAQNTYIYDVAAPAEIVNRYLDAVLGREEGFVLVDETYLHLEERPELADDLGALTIARPSVQSGHVFRLVIGWSEASTLTIRASVPEGAIREPEKEENGLGLGSQVIETIPLTEQIKKIQGMSPSQFGLSGDSMEDYDIYPVEGFVMVDGLTCRRFNVYVPRESGTGHYPDLEAVIFLSSDQKHVYRMDPVSNAVTELR